MGVEKAAVIYNLWIAFMALTNAHRVYLSMTPLKNGADSFDPKWQFKSPYLTPRIREKRGP
jgi:hypothetical protein